MGNKWGAIEIAYLCAMFRVKNLQYAEYAQVKQIMNGSYQFTLNLIGIHYDRPKWAKNTQNGNSDRFRVFCKRV